MNAYETWLENQLQGELLRCQARLARLQDIEVVCRSEFVQTQQREEQIQKHLAFLGESRRLNPRAFEYQPPEIDIWTGSQIDCQWQDCNSP